MRPFLSGKTVSKDIIVVIMCVYAYTTDPPKSTKIEAESLKEGIISAVKFTKVKCHNDFNVY